MTVRERILGWARNRKPFTTAELVPVFKITRQTLSEHLSILVTEGKLTRTGATRGAHYSLIKGGRKAPTRVNLVRQIKGLEEDRVFLELSAKADLKSKLNRNAFHIEIGRAHV